jgi:hypothetical protein
MAINVLTVKITFFLFDFLVGLLLWLPVYCVLTSHSFSYFAFSVVACGLYTRLNHFCFFVYSLDVGHRCQEQHDA